MNRGSLFGWMSRLARDYAANYDASTIVGVTPHCWLRADTVTSSGGLISQFTDKSGNGRHFTQSTGSKKPTLQTDSNGRAYALADGGDDGMVCSAFGAMNAITAFFVLRSVTTPASTGALLWIGNTTDAQSSQFSVASNGNHNSGYRNPSGSSSGMSIVSSYVADSGTTPVIWAASGTTQNGGSSIWEVRARLGVTGSLNGTAATGSTIANLAAGLFANKTAGASYLAAGLYEMIAYNAVLTTEQIYKVETMLMGYYYGI